MVLRVHVIEGVRFSISRPSGMARVKGRTRRREDRVRNFIFVVRIWIGLIVDVVRVCVCVWRRWWGGGSRETGGFSGLTSVVEDALTFIIVLLQLSLMWYNSTVTPSLTKKVTLCCSSDDERMVDDSMQRPQYGGQTAWRDVSYLAYCG